MNLRSDNRAHRWTAEVRSKLALACALTLSAVAPALAQEAKETESTLDLYGFAMLDMGYQSGQNDPDWFDVVRPTKLPYKENEFGEDGRFFASVRQSRFGVKSFTPTDLGELRTTFESELFGTGVDAGQTTLRLRHAYGEVGQIGADSALALTGHGKTPRHEHIAGFVFRQAELPHDSH